ncbi:MAG: hypothetical protein DRP60_08065 [Spirochaetes bacterium]|nr:MAG: hypothetical protein DRP60_08065 [Spirochaetota bacterium]
MSSHISVAGVARRGKDILVMRRLPGGSVGGLWEFPGGKAEKGEKPREALFREWMEETGLEITVGEEIVRGGFRHKGVPITLIAFNVELPSTDSEPELLEHDAFQWVKPEQLSLLALVDSDRIVADVILRESA